jgi:hypothetical protein
VDRNRAAEQPVAAEGVRAAAATGLDIRLAVRPFPSSGAAPLASHQLEKKTMALAIIVTLERDLPASQAAYAKAGSGKALARETDRLDTAARGRRVEQLTALLSESQAALAAQLKEQGFDPAKMRLPAEIWFPAAEGLKTVRALIEHVTAKLNDFKQPNPILRDLRAAEALLAEADRAAVRFHFTKTNV